MAGRLGTALKIHRPWFAPGESLNALQSLMHYKQPSLRLKVEMPPPRSLSKFNEAKFVDISVALILMADVERVKLSVEDNPLS